MVPAMVANPPVITLLISDLKDGMRTEDLAGCDISLLGHGGEEGSDQQGSLSLTQEDVSCSVHGLGCRGAHRDVEQPT